jgi:hypothetical protein
VDTLLGSAWLVVDCPQCGFGVQFQVMDVVTQTWVWCVCCRGHIRLVDARGSVSVGIRTIEAKLAQLTDRMS